jgi:O-antigen/teichoic acid export membrane protein
MLSLFSIPTALLGTAFQAKMMKKELYLIKIKHVFRIILFATLIPFYGIWGAVIASVGTDIFGVGLILFLFRKF